MLWQKIKFSLNTHNIRNNIIDLQHAISLERCWQFTVCVTFLLLPIQSLLDEQHNCTVTWRLGKLLWERKNIESVLIRQVERETREREREEVRQIDRRKSAFKVNLRVKLYFICSIYYQRIDCLLLLCTTLFLC